MPITVQCGACQKQFQAGDHLAGKQVKCPGCQTPLMIPGGPASSQQPAAANSLGDLFDDEMPVHHKSPDDCTLTEEEIDTLVDWLRGTWLAK